MKPVLPTKVYETSFDRIEAVYLDGENIELTEQEEEIQHRWETAFSMMVNSRTYAQTARTIMKLFKISRAQAYRDINNAERLFGSVIKSNKEAKRHIVSEMATRTFRMAYAKGNLTEMNRSLKVLSSVHGLDRDEPDLPDFSQINPPPIEINLPKQIQDLLMSYVSKGALNLDDIMNIEDVEIIDDNGAGEGQD